MDVRNNFVNSGRVSAHHFLPQSGWVIYWIKGEQDIPNVIELFKIRYDSLKPNTKLVKKISNVKHNAVPSEETSYLDTGPNEHLYHVLVLYRYIFCS